MIRPRKKSRRKRDSNPGSSSLEADALPLGQRGGTELWRHTSLQLCAPPDVPVTLHQVKGVEGACAERGQSDQALVGLNNNSSNNNNNHTKNQDCNFIFFELPTVICSRRTSFFFWGGGGGRSRGDGAGARRARTGCTQGNKTTLGLHIP